MISRRPTSLEDPIIVLTNVVVNGSNVHMHILCTTKTLKGLPLSLAVRTVAPAESNPPTSADGQRESNVIDRQAINVESTRHLGPGAGRGHQHLCPGQRSSEDVRAAHMGHPGRTYCRGGRGHPGIPVRGDAFRDPDISSG